MAMTDKDESMTKEEIRKMVNEFIDKNKQVFDRLAEI